MNAEQLVKDHKTALAQYDTALAVAGKAHEAGRVRIDAGGRSMVVDVDAAYDLIQGELERRLSEVQRLGKKLDAINELLEGEHDL